MSLRALSLIMCRKVIRESMQYYISIDLKSKGGEILKVKFVSTTLDTQRMNKATVEAKSSNGFKRNMHRKYIVSILVAGGRFKLSDLIFIHANRSKYTGLYK